MPAPLLAAGVVAVGGLMAMLLAAPARFTQHACANVEAALPAHIVGQQLALGALTDAVCQHLAQPRPPKPLVISVHGPPGVGKTFTHLWLARALYNPRPSAALQCPGMHCRGYKVVYGLDYLVAEASARLGSLKREVVAQLAATPDSLLVVEEYDKLDCAARGLWRQLLQHPERANITSNRAIILMESNLGMSELEELLTQMGDRDKVTMEAAEALLRDVVFAQWRAAGCESFADTLKLLSLIDAFLPYMPLEAQHMPALVELGLQARADALAAVRMRLTWDAAVPAALAAKVAWAGTYPLDGAKVVEPVLTRHVARPLRQAAALPACRARLGCSLVLSADGGGRLRLTVHNGTEPARARRKRGGGAVGGLEGGAAAAAQELQAQPAVAEL